MRHVSLGLVSHNWNNIFATDNVILLVLPWLYYIDIHLSWYNYSIPYLTWALLIHSRWNIVHHLECKYQYLAKNAFLGWGNTWYHQDGKKSKCFHSVPLTGLAVVSWYLPPQLFIIGKCSRHSIPSYLYTSPPLPPLIFPIVGTTASLWVVFYQLGLNIFLSFWTITYW